MHEVYNGPLEYANWQDEGCELCPSCLRCPLPRCIEEQPRGRQKYRLDRRSVDMLSMRRGGSEVREIAAAYRVSVRTVQRVLKKNNNPPSLEERGPGG